MPPKGDAVPADEIENVLGSTKARTAQVLNTSAVATKAADERRLDPLGVEPADRAGVDCLAVAALRIVCGGKPWPSGTMVWRSILLRPAANDEHLTASRPGAVLVRLIVSHRSHRRGLRPIGGFPELRDLRLGGTQSTTFPESFRESQPERLTVRDAMHQYNFGLRGEFEMVKRRCWGRITESMRPPLHQRTQRPHHWSSPVVREPIPEVVVKPEPVAEVQPRRFCQGAQTI